MGSSLEQLKWPEHGLLPAIAQDQNGQVLTLAWQNPEALQKTLETGLVHYWSRSRQALWQKGETSGNTQRILEVRIDCDYDAILMIVEPAGPACHTGKPSCFYHLLDQDEITAQTDNPWPPVDILSRLAQTIEQRRTADAGKSYVKTLLNNGEMAKAKIDEEAQELIEAITSESDDRVANETADLIFHALVAAAGRGVDWNQISRILTARFGTSGHDEKVARSSSQSNS